MSVILFAEVDGRHVPLRDCDWVLRGPCGCPFGVTVGAFPDLSHVTATEDAAWSQLYDTDEEIAAAKARGERVELMTRDRCRTEVFGKLSARCEHEKAAAS